MRTFRSDRSPVVITDAQQSADDELRSRKKVYAVLMLFHVVGFAAAGSLAIAQFWWVALGILAVTGPLPWVAVVIANDRRRRSNRHPPRHPSPNLPVPRNG